MCCVTLGHSVCCNAVPFYFVGYLFCCQFDALIVEPSPGTNAEEDGAETTSLEGAFDLFPELGQGWQAAFEKFLYLGDDRNIVQVYVAGNRLL